MEYKVFKAKTVNDAITDALIEFEITSEMLDYEVIEEGSAGILGLFSKDAVIKAKKKETVIEEEPEDFSIKDEIKSAARVDLRSAAAPSRRPAKTDDVKKAPKKDVPFTVKPDGEPESDEKLDISIKSISPAKPKAQPAAKQSYDNQEVNDILKLIFEKLDIQADIEATLDPDEKVININISGDNTADLIGKKGQTLDAIQYLISIIVNKQKGDYYRVKVDTNNYRSRRQKTLENQAKNVASKVKKTRRKVVMEPMNPYERRIIHSYLQSDKQVTTKSEGEEPNRKVVVYYKKS